MTDSAQTPYADSRTGRGDEWFRTIRELKEQAEALALYADAHRMFSAMIEDGFKTLPLDQSREIARAELQEFCAKRISIAQQTRAKRLRQAQGLEVQGVM